MADKTWKCRGCGLRLRGLKRWYCVPCKRAFESIRHARGYGPGYISDARIEELRARYLSGLSLFTRSDRAKRSRHCL